MVQEDVFILLTARLTGDVTTSALPAVYERNETLPYEALLGGVICRLLYFALNIYCGY